MPVALEHVLADARRRVLVQEVDGDVAHAALAEQRGQRLQTLLAAGDQHQRRPRLTDEAVCGRLADAAGCAGDEHDAGLALSVNRLSHDFLAVCGGPLA